MLQGCINGNFINLYYLQLLCTWPTALGDYNRTIFNRIMQNHAIAELQIPVEILPNSWHHLHTPSRCKH